MRNGLASPTFGIAAVIALALGAAACSGSDDDAAPATSMSSPASTAVVDAESDAATTAGPPASVDDSTGVTSVSAPLETTEVIATVPTDGVPGIESDDRFCQAWSEFGGSFQALTLAAHTAVDPVTAATAELAAANAITEAVRTMDVNFPADVDPADRALFLDGMLGPFLERAGEAQQLLLASGLSAQQVAELGEIWIATLIETGLGDSDITVEVPDDMQPAFDSAVAVWVDTDSIATDTDLVTDARAPQTEAYLAANCPDQGTLGGNDIVGD